MAKKNRYAWTWTIKEDQVDEYVRMHLNPWPEVQDAEQKARTRPVPLPKKPPRTDLRRGWVLGEQTAAPGPQRYSAKE